MSVKYKILMISISIGLAGLACKTLSQPITKVNPLNKNNGEKTGFETAKDITNDNNISGENNETTIPMNHPTNTPFQEEMGENIPPETITPSPTFEDTFTSGSEINPYPPSGSENNPYPPPESENITQIPTESGEVTPTKDMLTATATTTIRQTSQITTGTPQITLTPLPTSTSTLLQIPPWIAAELKASDPNLFKLSLGKPQFVFFFAYWCGPCQAAAPEVHALEEHYEESINFVYLDIDDPASEAIQEKLRHYQPPHYVLLDGNGEILKEWLGNLPFDDVVRIFETITPPN